MSRVFKNPQVYEKLCAERAALARAGKLDTHAIGQSGLVQEWEQPENWAPPVMPEKQSQTSVGPVRIDVVPPKNITPPSTYDLQRFNYLIDEDED